MANKLNQYSPRKVAGSFMGIQFLGLMPSSFYEVEYDEKAVTVHVSADGITSVVLNANQNAKAKVAIIQGSSTNDDLYKKVPNSKLNKLPSGDFSLVDLNGTSVVHSDKAFIEQVPKVVFSNDIQGREWTIILPDATIVPGGANS